MFCMNFEISRLLMKNYDRNSQHIRRAKILGLCMQIDHYQSIPRAFQDHLQCNNPVNHHEMEWIETALIFSSNTTFFNFHFTNTTHVQRYLAINPVSFTSLIFLFFTSIIQATVSNLIRAMAEVCTRDLFLLLPGGMMFT